MSQPWPFWLGGLALAGAALLHWLLLGRLIGVSGRLSGLVDRVRRRSVDEELVAEMERMTALAFPDARAVARKKAAPAWTGHLVFLVALVGGGALAPSPPEVTPSLWTLFAGGLLVGVGTRLAGGCTSGHGLSGISRLQPGSAVAIAAAFAGGIVTTLLLGAP